MVKCLAFSSRRLAVDIDGHLETSDKRDMAWPVARRAVGEAETRLCCCLWPTMVGMRAYLAMISCVRHHSRAKASPTRLLGLETVSKIGGMNPVGLLQSFIVPARSLFYRNMVCGLSIFFFYFFVLWWFRLGWFADLELLADIPNLTWPMLSRLESAKGKHQTVLPLRLLAQSEDGHSDDGGAPHVYAYETDLRLAQ
jgi:hypothetical protein